MEDTTRLRRTVRRCTAVLVAAVGVATWAVAGFGTARYGVALVVGAVLYLLASLVLVRTPPSDRGEHEPASE